MLNLLPTTFYLLLLDILLVCPSILCFVPNGLIWSKSRQDFISLFSLPWFAKLRNEFLNETSAFIQDCNGEEIRIGYYEDKNMLRFYENNTKISGIFGDIWNILADHLNFTLVPVHQIQHDVGGQLCNGTYTGLLGLIEQKKIHAIARTSAFVFLSDVLDYTVPVWRNRYKLYIRPVYKLDNTWIITLLSPTTWYCVLSLFFVLSLAGYILQNTESINNKLTNAVEQQEFSFFEHMFYTYSLICSQGYIPSQFYNRYKLLSFTKSMFCWFTLIAFSSHLIYRMTNRTLVPPFTDHVSLLNSTDFVLLTFKGASIFDIFKHLQGRPFNLVTSNIISVVTIAGCLPQLMKLVKYFCVQLRCFQESVDKAAIDSGIVHIEQRFRTADTTSEMYNRVCYSQKSYAMLEMDDRFLANGRLVCSLMGVGRSYFDSWAVLAVAKGFRYKKLFNEVIMKLWEFGILDSLMHRYMGLDGDKILKNNNFKTIDMDQVHLIFLILACGAIFASAIFVVEQIVFLRNLEYARKSTIKGDVSQK